MVKPYDGPVRVLEAKNTYLFLLYLTTGDVACIRKLKPVIHHGSRENKQGTLACHIDLDQNDASPCVKIRLGERSEDWQIMDWPRKISERMVEHVAGLSTFEGKKRLKIKDIYKMRGVVSEALRIN